MTASLAEVPELDGLELAAPAASVEEERADRKQKLAGALRLFAKYRYDEGVAGHFSVRDPELKDHFWVNPMGLYFGLVTPQDLVLVDQDGTVVEGTRKINKAAFVIHGQIHEARPDVVAAAHAHSPSGRALAALGTPLLPLVQEACAFFEDHAVYDRYDGLILDIEQGRDIAKVLGDCKAILLQHHGLITVGDSIDEAAFWFLSFERCAEIQLTACAAGKPRVMSDQEARIAHRQFGSSRLASYSFEILWAMILAENPELSASAASRP